MLDVTDDGLAEDGSVGHDSAKDEHDAGQHPEGESRHPLNSELCFEQGEMTSKSFPASFTFERIWESMLNTL